MHGGEPLNPDLASRLQQSASWADWAPGMKQAIRVAIVALIKDHGLGGEHLRKALSVDQWRQHIYCKDTGHSGETAGPACLTWRLTSRIVVEWVRAGRHSRWVSMWCHWLKQ